MQDALPVRVDQGTGDIGRDLDGRRDTDRSLAEQVRERPVFEVLHHVVRRIGVPTDRHQSNDLPRGVERRELFHLALQQRPVETPAVVVELDRDALPGVDLAREPDRTERPLPDQLITRNLTGWHDGAAAQFGRTGLARFALWQCVVQLETHSRPP